MTVVNTHGSFASHVLALNGFKMVSASVSKWLGTGTIGAGPEPMWKMCAYRCQQTRREAAPRRQHRLCAGNPQTTTRPQGCQQSQLHQSADTVAGQHASMHIDVGDQPERESTGVGTAGYQKVYGPEGTCEDKASFRRSLETGKAIQVKDLKAFLGICDRRTGGNVIRGGSKPELQGRLADDVDMDIFFGEGCPGAWAPNSGTQITREKCHVSAIVAAWSDSRLFDEFLAWGYDLPLFTWSLANHSPVRNPLPAAHSYDLENDWPRRLVDNWDDSQGYTNGNRQSTR